MSISWEGVSNFQIILLHLMERFIPERYRDDDQMTTRTKVIQRLLATLLLLLGLPANRAALQFDVFPGFESTIHEAEWFPITFEIFNDGPSFNGVIEVYPSGEAGQVRRVPIELPTNTRKRLTVPMFASGHRYTAPKWDAKLLDSGGKERGKRMDMTTPMVAWESILLGGIPKTFGGLPVFPQNKTRQASQMETQPKVGRLQVEQFPDNPIALEGLDALYLNSEKALELRAEQVAALVAWVRGGGHLIVAVEQNADITATPWLRQFVPLELTGFQNVELHSTIISWLKETPNQPRSVRQHLEQDESFYYSVPEDPAYKESAVPVATGTIRDGAVLIGGATPLAITGIRGRGKVTVLTFSPEREPFRSWKERGHFWARLAGVPGAVFTRTDNQSYGGNSADGIFGALIDSRQIKKLPVTWLLILLLVYLVVIGPFDQWWLKKIGRQMLTWITFPAYVVLFSLLIYFIGYKLRAGETEWNELNVVDVFPRGDKVDMRGRTFISIYSSGNARYQLNGQSGYATIRPELIENQGRSDGALTVQHTGNSFKSEVFVPVWTSLLFVNDWFKTNDTPFLASVGGSAENRTVEIKNLLKVPLKDVRVVVDERVHEVGDIDAGATKTVAAAANAGTPLQNFIQSHGSYFQQATERRRNALGDSGAAHLEDRPLTGTVASFIGYLDNIAQHGPRGFIAPAGLDLSEQAARGDAIIMAFLPNQTFGEDINQFKTPRFRRDTLLRLVLPVKKNSI